jgi:DnaK suppressor protein
LRWRKVQALRGEQAEDSDDAAARAAIGNFDAPGRTMKHLSRADQEAIGQRLQTMQDNALKALRETGDVVGNDEPQLREVGGYADQAEAQRLDEIRMAEYAIDRNRLRDIELAQERMAHGQYGLCVDCGAEIPRDRLLVQPIAARCAPCQAALEHHRPL